VAMTADLLTAPRRCGLGAVALARLSGRPIVPVAIASSRYWSLTPTRYTINLPFSRLGMVVGDPIFIPRNAEPAEIERWRQRVEGALNNVTRKAYAQAGSRT
jgi:3-deoxy-D-manno-octulosonic-acid transferase